MKHRISEYKNKECFIVMFFANDVYISIFTVIGDSGFIIKCSLKHFCYKRIKPGPNIVFCSKTGSCLVPFTQECSKTIRRRGERRFFIMSC